MIVWKIDHKFYIYLAVLLLLLPLRWLIAWAWAVVLHESFHYITLKLCGGVVKSISVSISGAEIECSGLSKGGFFLSVLAGPIGGFTTIFLAQWIPRFAICSWGLSIYNLLPVLPLDGGKALRILVGNDAVFRICERIILIFISLLSIYLCFYMHLGILPMLIAVLLFVKNRKIPCKERLSRVQ